MFEADKAVVRAAVARDPAFAGHDLAEPLARMEAAGARDAFLKAAMRVMAVAGNGHSRIIPNAAIRVCPVRIVSRGEGFVMWREGAWHDIRTVNGRPTAEVFDALRPHLAGTAMRQRVIGAILLGWPAFSGEETVAYGLEVGEVRFAARDLVQASSLYPVGETGMRLPGQDDFALPGGQALAWDVPLWRVRIADLSVADPEELTAAAETIRSRPRAGLIVDLRGNPGGSFLRAVPMIEALRDGYRGRCAVLVDRFTFSAAIVVAVLLQHHVGARLFGEEMGDGLAFWAEGGTVDLPETGAHLRWSDGWHDWETGTATEATPREIARHMVATGPLRIAGTVADGLHWASA